MNEMSPIELPPIPMSHRDQTVGFGKGWYCVAESAEISADTLLPVSYFDRELIVFRDKNGDAKVADAYCPHLGAHLASADGCIDAGEIVCPFHKWRFDATSGKCNSIPYTKFVPPQAKLSFYPTMEMNGMVLMWWHNAGAAPEAKPYNVIEAHSDKVWLPAFERSFETTVPLRDLHENIFDTAHIQQLHRSNGMPEIADVVRHDFGLEVNFEAMPDGERTAIHFMQFNFSGMSMVSHVVLGTGYGFCQNNTITPIDRERSLMRIRMFMLDTGSPEMNEQIGKAFAARVMTEIDQDMKVLNFKKHLERPLICAGDGPIMKWREYAEELLAA
ncbi:Rieske 2Fe-2S domain-containing protein [Sphingomonas crocodyli]|uniref:Rieske domain-containing protein n=1 Tax=Sphingomonas crocodyli TaxID=1979270 RepID=A0A437M143_9SPHN|nr:Rieske 2Fe-2S domain-containing protein [Sphingomonas crocodyli]RVT91273.1 hypothetical protein EOD43_17340 [Sphingomonas crocodyli]